MPADDRTWRQANGAWAVFFVLLAAANHAFAQGFTHSLPGSPDQKWWESAWATWKLVTIGVVFVFALVQAFWLTRRAEAVASGS
ncbi:MAG: septation protein IspZ [Pseudomonadota bacterium]